MSYGGLGEEVELMCCFDWFSFLNVILVGEPAPLASGGSKRRFDPLCSQFLLQYLRGFNITFLNCVTKYRLVSAVSVKRHHKFDDDIRECSHHVLGELYNMHSDLLCVLFRPS